MKIDASTVKKLRDITGASFAKCKEALEEADGDLAKAQEYLKKKGAKIAAKRSERSTSQGIIDCYVHPGGKVGVLLELLCETDFVAKNNDFQELAHDVAMQIAAMDPRYICQQDIPQEILDKEREAFLEQAKSEGKKEDVAKKMVEGKLAKLTQEICLLDQPFVKDPETTVRQLIEAKITKIGENIKVGRFVRLSI